MPSGRHRHVERQPSFAMHAMHACLMAITCRVAGRF
jgi:hypothetical protein